MRLARRAGGDDSAAIDNAQRHPTEPTMTIATRLQAFAAAAFITLTMLAGIDHLAATDGAAAMLAQTAAARSAS
jgi:hypothetical protein